MIPNDIVRSSETGKNQGIVIPSFELQKTSLVHYDGFSEEGESFELTHSDGGSRLETSTFSAAAQHTQSLDSYIFSKDFLPTRFDRHAVSDLPLRLMVLLELAVNLALLVVFVQASTDIYFSSIFGIIQYAIIWFFFGLTIFWFNYKLHSLLFSVYRLFVDLDCTKRNSKYYSGLEIPDFYVQSEEYPHITIQIPVYKENLQNTIKPTLLHCCREADRYMDETGAYCNIIVCDDGYNLISENDRIERVSFYKDIGVGFTARPHPSLYPRRGRFKKAGNLNFSMNFHELLMMEDGGPQELARKRDKLLDLGTAYGGDVSYGQYIFLIDSDTRLPDIPIYENGCLKRLAKEMKFDGQDVLFIQCYTGPYMSVKTYSEKSIFNHTCSIYNSILVATAVQSMAPLVGHNAFLNMAALIECSNMDESGYKFFWAEDRISEDFDLMMRGCEKGYIGRYASHAGIFLEGVSFSYMTEYFKISKFACGAAELIYNPIADWYKCGVISSDLIGFIKSKKIEWYNKFIILAYILNFIALAAAHFGLLFNMFFCEFLVQVLPISLMPINLMWESLFIWTLFGGVTTYLFGLRLGFDKWVFFKQLLRETALLTCLYGSISVRFSIMSFTHLFKWNLSFGATVKDDEKVTLSDWVKSTPMETTIYSFYGALIAVKLLLFTPPDKVFFVVYFGCIPLMWTIFLFWAGPLFFDILIWKKDKTVSTSYMKDEMMFVDKYLTQLPNSPAYTNIKVGSSAKLAPPSCSGSMTKHTLSDTTRSRSSSITSYRLSQSMQSIRSAQNHSSCDYGDDESSQISITTPKKSSRYSTADDLSPRTFSAPRTLSLPSTPVGSSSFQSPKPSFPIAPPSSSPALKLFTSPSTYAVPIPNTFTSPRTLPLNNAAALHTLSLPNSPKSPPDTPPASTLTTSKAKPKNASSTSTFSSPKTLSPSGA